LGFLIEWILIIFLSIKNPGFLFTSGLGFCLQIFEKKSINFYHLTYEKNLKSFQKSKFPQKQVTWCHIFFSCISAQFRRLYDKGDLPVSLNCGEEEGRLRGKATMDLLDYHSYLPLFFDGLRNTEESNWYFSYFEPVHKM
jgi:hypothetical protein